MSGTGDLGFKGEQPIIRVKAGNPEAQKYGKMWALEEYRRVAPGEDLAGLFLEVVKPKPGADVIDFGCGTGRGGAALLERGGLRVTLVDFVRNCLDQKVVELIEARPADIRFVKHDLEEPLQMGVEYGYCTDVMEHVPEVRVPVVLLTILGAARHVFFSISTEGDRCGELIGETLHLTVQKYGWWLKQFNALDCVVHWSQSLDGAVLFYVSAWRDAQEVVDIGVVNTPEEKVRENVRANVAGDWELLTPHEANDVEVMIVGGGPTVNEHVDEIKQKRAEGVKLVTLNNAYNWALDHGLTPSATVVVDSRPFNARFVKPVVDGCKYLVASQCDPSVFEGLPRDRTLIWHTSAPFIKDILDEAYPLWYGITGGSTALLRAIPLMRSLGFKRFHLYGCDSCVKMGTPDDPIGGMSVTGVSALAAGESVGQHHAYPQPENDNEGRVYAVNVGGRTFWCKAWMVSQAQEFINLVHMLGDQFELEVHGDGLLRHILVTGAKMIDEMDAEQAVEPVVPPR